MGSDCSSKARPSGLALLHAKRSRKCSKRREIAFLFLCRKRIIRALGFPAGGRLDVEFTRGRGRLTAWKIRW
jgi:hypothetical protein